MIDLGLRYTSFVHLLGSPAHDDDAERALYLGSGPSKQVQGSQSPRHHTRTQREGTQLAAHLNQPNTPRHSISRLNRFQAPSVYGGYRCGASNHSDLCSTALA